MKKKCFLSNHEISSCHIENIASENSDDFTVFPNAQEQSIPAKYPLSHDGLQINQHL